VILDCLQPAASVYWHRTFVGIIVTTFEHPLRGKSFVAIIGAVRKRPPLRESYAGHFIADANIAVALLTQEECDQQTGRDARDRSEQPQPPSRDGGRFRLRLPCLTLCQHPTGCRHPLASIACHIDSTSSFVGASLRTTPSNARERSSSSHAIEHALHSRKWASSAANSSPAADSPATDSPASSRRCIIT
jgi:hypothetical protein